MIKTHKALLDSFFELLRGTTFGHITVNMLCNEAQVSRATFYAHFEDKYDLLKYALERILPFQASEDDTEIERVACRAFETHRKLFKNLIYNADDETYDIFRAFVSVLIGIPIPSNPKDIPRYEVFSHVLTGGGLKYLNRLIRNPATEAAEIAFFFQLLRALRDSYKARPDDDTPDDLLNKPKQS